MFKYLFFGLVIIILVFPLQTSAQERGFLGGPIVPCGIESDSQRDHDCTLCDIFVLAKNIINFLFELTLVIAPVFVLIGGGMILLSAGTPAKIDLGKRIILSTVIGIVIALVSWTALNMLFNNFIAPDVAPWPWYNPDCEGGGYTPPPPPPEAYCVCEYGNNNIRATRMEDADSCSFLCTWSSSSTYCTPNTTTATLYCVEESELDREVACLLNEESYERLNPGTCYTLPDCHNAIDNEFSNQCYVNNVLQCQCLTGLVDQPDPCPSQDRPFALYRYSYEGFVDCDDVLGCSNRLGGSCDYCRLNHERCGGIVEEGWCQRPAPAGSENWILNPPPGGASERQKGDASPTLTNFLNCMYSRIPNLRINSISNNILCSNPACDITTPDCGHEANSCHFGGLNCPGRSYAVDFDDQPVACLEIEQAAMQCDPGAWFYWENNHAHITVRGVACGCNRYQRPCP